MPNHPLIAELETAVGASALLTTAPAMLPYVTDWRGRYQGQALAVARPASTAEVAAVVRACVRHNAPMVPQGGNTGLCGASVPDQSARAVVVSLQRLNRVRSVDLDNDTITVEAGCILSHVQQAAAEQQRLFPLSLAAEGSCTIGGNVSTNAGGVQVLRYGNTREQVLGLEVVLPDGEIWHGLRGLRKDNTGYDLKQLFIGAEGTLGIVTAVVLKLYPSPKSVLTAWVALGSPEAALQLLRAARSSFADRLTTFELVSRICVDLVLKHLPNARDPFQQQHAWYALLELSDTVQNTTLREALETLLQQLLEDNVVIDATIAESHAQAQALWALRENISEAQRLEGNNIKHDISVPISRIPAFMQEAAEALARPFPGIRVVAFGHLGDGNLHYNVSAPLHEDHSGFLRHAAAVNEVVHDLVHRYQGSISAEHGIGQLKLEQLPRYKSALELNLMRSIKRALDPRNLMNPGKILA